MPRRAAGDAFGGEKFLRKSTHSGLCDAKSGTPCESFFYPPFNPQGRPRRSRISNPKHRSVDPFASRTKKKCAFSRCFFTSASGMGARAAFGAGAGGDRGRGGRPSGATPALEKSFAKVLTP
jgi:hypothetical protein